MNSTDTLNVGLLLVRVMFAALLLGHSTQKLFGWFHGMGPSGTGAVFEQWGFAPGAAMAVTAGVCELLGLGSVALGLLVPGGCALLVGTMLVATAPYAKNGVWAHRGGCEVPLVYCGLAAVIAFTGPGRFSLDHAFGLDGLHAFGWSLAAVVAGVLAAIPPLLRRRTTLAAAASSSPSSPTPSQSDTHEVNR